jgi:hypothetical protein
MQIRHGAHRAFHSKGTGIRLPGQETENEQRSSINIKYERDLTAMFVRYNCVQDSCTVTFCYRNDVRYGDTLNTDREILKSAVVVGLPPYGGDRFLKRPLLTVFRSFMNVANRVL